MKTINNVKITPPPPSPPPEVGLGDSNFCEGVSNINMSKTLASNNEKRWIWKNLPPHPLEGGGVRPQNFSKILLRGKKQLTKNFKSIGTLIQKLLIFGAFLAKMFHSALGWKMNNLRMHILTWHCGTFLLKRYQKSITFESMYLLIWNF